jgi:hypothetical protein
MSEKGPMSRSIRSTRFRSKACCSAERRRDPAWKARVSVVPWGLIGKRGCDESFCKLLPIPMLRAGERRVVGGGEKSSCGLTARYMAPTGGHQAMHAKVAGRGKLCVCFGEEAGGRWLGSTSAPAAGPGMRIRHENSVNPVPGFLLHPATSVGFGFQTVISCIIIL